MKKITEFVDEFKATALASVRTMEDARRELSEWLMKAVPTQMKVTLHLATTQDENDELDSAIQELIEELDYMEMGKFLIGSLNEKTLGQLIDDVSVIVNNLHTEITSMKAELDGISTDTLFWAFYKPTCPKCGCTTDPTDSYCHTCGEKLTPMKEYEAPETIDCVKCDCGRAYDKNWAFCPACGKENVSREEPKKITPFCEHYARELRDYRRGE